MTDQYVVITRVYWNADPCVKTCAVFVSRVGRVSELEMNAIPITTTIFEYT